MCSVSGLFRPGFESLYPKNSICKSESFRFRKYIRNMVREVFWCSVGLHILKFFIGEKNFSVAAFFWKSLRKKMKTNVKWVYTLLFTCLYSAPKQSPPHPEILTLCSINFCLFLCNGARNPVPETIGFCVFFAWFVREIRCRKWGAVTSMLREACRL